MRPRHGSDYAFAMADESFQFEPIEFRKTTHAEMGMFDGDHTHGDDYGAGQLLSLAVAKKQKALLFVVRFGPGIDAAAVGWKPEDTGDVELVLFEKKGRFLGGINRQAPERYVWMTGEKIDLLDGIERERGRDGRYAAHWFCSRHLKTYSGGAHLTVEVRIKKGLLGGWKEIVVKVPKKELYVASL